MNRYRLAKWVLNKTKYPAYYTAVFTGLAVGTKIIEDLSVGNLENILSDSKNIAGILAKSYALINIGYASGVELATKRFGRIGGNTVCLITNVMLAAYAYHTSDTNPTLPLLVNAGLGAYMTNKQITNIQKQALPTLDIPSQGI